MLLCEKSVCSLYKHVELSGGALPGWATGRGGQQVYQEDYNGGYRATVCEGGSSRGQETEQLELTA